MRFGTDKVALGYLPAYLRIAAALGTAARVCEVGVDNGAGLDMFQALFPAGLVAGVDAEDRCRWPDGTIQIVARQDDPALPGLLAEHAPAWDLIADDASHIGALTSATFGLLWPLVAPGGVYVVEDWQVALGGFPGYDASMLRAVGSLLPMLTEDSDVDHITYRHGMAIVHKKAGP